MSHITVAGVGVTSLYHCDMCWCDMSHITVAGVGVTKITVTCAGVTYVTYHRGRCWCDKNHCDM